MKEVKDYQMSKAAQAGNVACLIALYALVGGSAVYYIIS